MEINPPPLIDNISDHVGQRIVARGDDGDFSYSENGTIPHLVSRIDVIVLIEITTTHQKATHLCKFTYREIANSRNNST